MAISLRRAHADMATPQMDKAQQIKYNAIVLQRRDPAITGVVDMAAHVHMYKFNEETQVLQPLCGPCMRGARSARARSAGVGPTQRRGLALRRRAQRGARVHVRRAEPEVEREPH